jgi:type III secretion protein S
MIVLIVSAPPLIAAIVVGVLVGLVQALTQIQDQTLPQGVKILVVLVVIAVLGPSLSTQIGSLATTLLNEFPALTR